MSKENLKIVNLIYENKKIKAVIPEEADEDTINCLKEAERILNLIAKAAEEYELKFDEKKNQTIIKYKRNKKETKKPILT